MITVSNENKAVFYRVGEREGWVRLFAERVEKAVRALKDCAPEKTAEIARLQQAIQIYESDLPSVIKQVEEYAAECSRPSTTA